MQFEPKKFGNDIVQFAGFEEFNIKLGFIKLLMGIFIVSIGFDYVLAITRS